MPEVSLTELRALVSDVVAEAKRKSKGKKKEEAPPRYEAEGKGSKGYSYAENFDFSLPLGTANLYRAQGASNIGPWTGEAIPYDPSPELKEALERDPWGFLSEVAGLSSAGNVWESASHWYDFQGLGLGGQTSEGIEEKKLGFKKLKGKLSREKGVTDPAALAASIGRRKYGAAGMAAKSAAARRK
jgi:hypothetical protein